MSRSLRVLFCVIFVGALFLVSQSKYRPEISDWGRIIACVAIFVGMLLSHRDDKQRKPGNVLFLSGLGTLLLINLGSSFGSHLSLLWPWRCLEKEFIYTDFRHFYYGAEAVYVLGQDPYLWHDRGDSWALPGIGYPNAFPYPTYFLFHLLSLGNRLSLVQTGCVVVYVMVLLLLSGFYLTGQLIRSKTEDRETQTLFFVLCIGSGFASGGALGLLQTSVMCFFGVSLVLYLWIFGRGNLSILLAGWALSYCVLLKPNLTILYGFFLTAFLLGIRKRRRKIQTSEGRRAALIGLWASVFLLLLPTATIFIPGGLSFSHYAMFPQVLAKTMIQNTTSGAARWNFSPIYILHTRLQNIFGSDSVSWAIPWSSVAATFAIIMILLWSYPRFKEADCLSRVSPWLVSTLIPFPFVWYFYAPWIIPAGAHVISSAVRCQRREGLLAGCCLLGLLHMTSSFLFSVGFLLLFVRSLLSLAEGERAGLSGPTPPVLAQLPQVRGR